MKITFKVHRSTCRSKCLCSILNSPHMETCISENLEPVLVLVYPYPPYFYDVSILVCVFELLLVLVSVSLTQYSRALSGELIKIKAVQLKLTRARPQRKRRKS